MVIIGICPCPCTRLNILVIWVTPAFFCAGFRCWRKVFSSAPHNGNNKTMSASSSPKTCSSLTRWSFLFLWINLTTILAFSVAAVAAQSACTLASCDVAAMPLAAILSSHQVSIANLLWLFPPPLSSTRNFVRTPRLLWTLVCEAVGNNTRWRTAMIDWGVNLGKTGTFCVLGTLPVLSLKHTEGPKPVPWKVIERRTITNYCYCAFGIIIIDL